MEPPGLYRTVGSPGSARDLSDRRQAAWPCRLAVLRHHGVYLPAPLILRRTLYSGWMLSRDADLDIRVCSFVTSLEQDGGRSPVEPLKVRPQSVRQNPDGTYLLQGVAWDEGYLGEWQQDWLCGPNNDVVTAAINRMAGWLAQRYTGHFGR